MSEKPVPHPVVVWVTDRETRFPPEVTGLWDVMGCVVRNACQELGDDIAFSVLLSRITRELRAKVGSAGAKQSLEGYIASMHEAALLDDETPTRPNGAGHHDL